MKRPRSVLLLAVTLAALLVSPITSAASVIGDTTPVVAVTGLNQALYAKRLSAPNWTNRGGALVAAPAVSNVGPTLTHYVGIGRNYMLYQRTDTVAPRSMAQSGANAFLFVTGTNGALYVCELTPDATIGWSSIPSLSRFGPAASRWNS